MRWCRGLFFVCAIIAIIVVVAFAEPRGDPASASGTVAAVTAGSGHTCALTTDGALACWGANRNGQLGDGEACGDACTRPVSVVGLDSNVVSSSAGDFHTCAVTTAGGVMCWGRNDDGQLGDGTTVARDTPTEVSGPLDDAIGVSAGEKHSCALTAAGAVRCWGSNDDGQLGDGGVCGDTCSAPAGVVGLDGVAAVSAGDHHTCAVTPTGGVKCWGSNVYGALGDGGACGSECSTPVDVAGLSSEVAAVSAGNSHACALTNAGIVRCWGRNVEGQLGDGTTSLRFTPVDVIDLPAPVASISTGDFNTCALLVDGRVRCWGMHVHGPISEGAFQIRTRPVRVSGLADISLSVSAGDYHTCVVISGGSLKCWGPNAHGQLGDGRTSSRAYLADVVGLGGGAKPAPAPTLTATPTQFVLAATATLIGPPTSEPPATATDTPVDTATPSPTEPAATETPPPTAVPTAMLLLAGDANGNGAVNAVDATLILQYAAGRPLTLTEASDVNGDGSTNAIDGGLVLQYVSGLLGSL